MKDFILTIGEFVEILVYKKKKKRKEQGIPTYKICKIIL